MDKGCGNDDATAEELHGVKGEGWNREASYFTSDDGQIGSDARRNENDKHGSNAHIPIPVRMRIGRRTAHSVVSETHTGLSWWTGEVKPLHCSVEGSLLD